MDMSGSMWGSRWTEAKQAVMKIAPFACQADADGITLYLFNHTHKKFTNITTAEAVQGIFRNEDPDGSTNLQGVLHAAFGECFESKKGSTILVVTDGQPNDETAVKKEIIAASQSIERDEDLSVSFIQIGDDSSATRFLKGLDDNLKDAKFDIVDTVSFADLNNMTFEQLIDLSIKD